MTANPTANVIPVFAFDRDTPEDLIAGIVDSASGLAEAEKLAALLPEEHPLYTGRGSNQTARLRGYILASFERTGLPDQALPYVLDDLQNGNEVYLVAAAAAALRGSVPAAAYIPYLLKAVRNTRYRDDSITFECYKPVWPVRYGTTALAELFKTFAWLGGEGREALTELKIFSRNEGCRFSRAVRAHIDKAIESIESSSVPAETGCCLLPLGFDLSPRSGEDTYTVDDLELQDHDGKTFRYSEFFHGKPSIVVFFYTRCNNPNKCSLTVTKLAQLQKALKARGLDGKIQTAAVTYDPGFDLPFRLKLYGEARGVIFDEQNKILRTPHGLAPLQTHFRLGVNFISSIVNRHRIELFILDEAGKVKVSFQRSQWNVEDVIHQARAVLEKTNENNPRSGFLLGRFDRAKPVWRRTASFVFPLAIVFFPKCPLCWAAYLSVFGITAFSSIPFSPWLLYPLILLMLANLGAIYKRSKRENHSVPFYVSSAGVLILLAAISTGIHYLSYIGLALTFVGSLPVSLYIKRQVISDFFSR